MAVTRLVGEPVEEQRADDNLEDIDFNAEAMRVLVPQSLANLEVALVREGHRFTHAGVYRDFNNLDDIYNVEPDAVVPEGLVLVRDGDLIREPARSRILGRQLTTLEDIGPFQSEAQAEGGFRVEPPVQADEVHEGAERGEVQEEVVDTSDIPDEFGRVSEDEDEENL